MISESPEWRHRSGVDEYRKRESRDKLIRRLPHLRSHQAVFPAIIRPGKWYPAKLCRAGPFSRNWLLATARPILEQLSGTQSLMKATDTAVGHPRCAKDLLAAIARQSRDR